MSETLKSDVALLPAALLVSFAALYFSNLQPGRPVGVVISYPAIWRFSNLSDGAETDFTFSPVLSITNVGARTLMIVNLRLRLSPEQSDDFNAYPTNTIPEQAITANATCERSNPHAALLGEHAPRAPRL